MCFCYNVRVLSVLATPISSWHNLLQIRVAKSVKCGVVCRSAVAQTLPRSGGNFRAILCNSVGHRSEYSLLKIWSRSSLTNKSLITDLAVSCDRAMMLMLHAFLLLFVSQSQPAFTIDCWLYSVAIAVLDV